MDAELSERLDKMEDAISEALTAFIEQDKLLNSLFARIEAIEQAKLEEKKP